MQARTLFLPFPGGLGVLGNGLIDSGVTSLGEACDGPGEAASNWPGAAASGGSRATFDGRRAKHLMGEEQQHLAVEVFKGRLRISYDVGNHPASTMFR